MRDRLESGGLKPLKGQSMIKTPEDRQAGAEIEVTPEMIEAGVEAYVFFDPRVDEKEGLVVDV